MSRHDLMLDIATATSETSPFDSSSPSDESSPPSPSTNVVVNIPPLRQQHLDVIASKSASFKWLHDHAWRRGRKTHTVLAISHMAFVLITGVLNIVASFAIPPQSAPTPPSPKEDPPQAVDISSAVFLFLSLVIAGAQHLLRWEQTAESHRMSALRFSALYRNILRHKSTTTTATATAAPPSTSTPVNNNDHYFTWVTGEYDTLCNQAPRIPDAVIRHFHSTFHHPPPEEDNNNGNGNGNGTNADADPELSQNSPLSAYTSLDTAAFRYELDRFMLNEYQLR